MRRVLPFLLAAIVAAGCSSAPVEPLTVDSAAGGAATGGASNAAGSEESATAVDPASPIVRPSTPQAPGVSTEGVATVDDAAPQRPGDIVPSDPVLPGPATPPTIGDFCAEHLDPAREILERAEESGEISPEDRATVQSTLDVALDYCTPAEYFAFQQELFAFVDPSTASTAPPQQTESELVG